MNLVKVKPAKVLRPVSADCPNHFMNVIVDGRCKLHGPEFERSKLEAKQKSEKLWQRV